MRLNLDVTMEHGDRVISSTTDGKTFERVADEYASWLRAEMLKSAPAAHRARAWAASQVRLIRAWWAK